MLAFRYFADLKETYGWMWVQLFSFEWLKSYYYLLLLWRNIRNMRTAIIFLLSFLVFSSSFGQWLPEGLRSSPRLEARDSAKLTVKGDILGFFKNDEYVSPVSKGKTLPGMRVEPSIGYQLGTSVRAELILNAMYYSGDVLEHGDKFVGSVGARLQYSPQSISNLHLLLGNYYGGANHRLVEPMYAWERHLVDKSESGLQVLYDSGNFFGDVWVNWRQYIEQGDSVPEILTFGVSSELKLPSLKNGRLNFKIPFQLLIYHEGGEIDVSDSKMVVVGNLATGVCAEYKVDRDFLKSIGLNVYALGYYDKRPDLTKRPYDKGWALYPTLQFDASPFKASFGYWHGHKYFSFLGESLFNSFNMYNPDEVLPKRDLFVAKFLYSKQITKGFTWGAHLDTYSELRGTFKMNYSFGVYMRFNTRFY